MVTAAVCLQLSITPACQTNKAMNPMSYIGQWYIPYKMHLDFWGSLLWFCLLCRNAFHKQSHSLDADSATCAADSTERIIKNTARVHLLEKLCDNRLAQSILLSMFQY